MSKDTFVGEVLQSEKDGDVFQTVAFVLNETDEFKAIGSNGQHEQAHGRSAFTAYLDYLRHGCYDNPYTDGINGIFVKDTADTTEFLSSRLGYICAGHGNPDFPEVNVEQYPFGVAELNIFNGKWALSGVVEQQARYALWMQYAAQSVNVSIAIPVFLNNWVTTLIETASIKNAKKRRETRDSNIARASDKKRISRAVGKGMKAAKSGDVSGVPSGPIVVKLFDSDESVDMTTLEPQRVNIHTNRGDVQSESWAPTMAKKFVFDKVSKMDGWSVELAPTE